MSTVISRVWLSAITPALHGLLDAIDAMFANDLEFGGHVGIGRPPTEVPLHVSQSVVADGTNTTTLQVDKIVTGGAGGVHTAIKGQTIARPGWDSNGGQLFGVTGEAEIACPGTGEIWGGQDHAKVLLGADPGNEACGREIDLVTEVPVKTRWGQVIGAMPFWQRPMHQGFRATGLDFMLGFVNKKFGAQWKTGISFFQADPTKTIFPIAQDGTIFVATPTEHTTVKEGIDFSDPFLHFSGHSIKVPGFKVTGNGLVEITGILCWTAAALVTDPVTGERTLRIQVDGKTEKLRLK